MGAVSCGCSNSQDAFVIDDKPFLSTANQELEEKAVFAPAAINVESEAGIASESILNVDPNWSRLTTQEKGGDTPSTSMAVGTASCSSSPTVVPWTQVEVLQSPSPVPEEDLSRDVVEVEIQRIRAAVEEEEAALSSDSWRDISKPSTKILFKSKQKPSRDCLWIVLDSEKHVPALPMLETKDGKIVCGAIPTCLAAPHYPQWFPFCESNTVLRQFSPSCFMMHCKLKVLFVCIDFVLLVNVQDLLDAEKECMEVTFSSPPAGSEGAEWLGVQLPPKPGAFPRIPIRHGLIRLRPTSPHSAHLEWQMELEDVSGAPQWIKVFAIQQVAVRLVPELARMQPKIPGSPIDRYLNGQGDDCMSQESLNFVYDLDRSITRYLDRVDSRQARTREQI